MIQSSTDRLAAAAMKPRAVRGARTTSRKRASVSVSHVVIACSVMAVVLGGFLLLASRFPAAPVSPPHGEQAVQRPEPIVGRVVITDGDSCRRTTFDNASGRMAEGQQIPCTEQAVTGAKGASRIEAVRRSFNNRKGDPD